MSDSRKVEALRRLLTEHGIRRGAFRLASGATSDYYCNVKSAALSPVGASLIGELMLPFVAAVEAEAVGGMALGALFVSAPVVSASVHTERLVYGFTVRESVKDHGLETSVEQSYHPDGRPLLCEGRKVAVVDDVVTLGGSILKAIREVQSRGCEVVAALALVDRGAGAGDRLRSEEVPYHSLYTVDAQGRVV